MHLCQQRTPEFFFLFVRIPSVDVVIHGLAKIRQDRKVEMLLDCSLKLVPGPVEKTVQFTTGVPADHWDAESGNELCQGAAAAFFDGVMDSLIGFLTESVRADDFIPELIQLIEITEILHPAMANEFFQRHRR